MEVQGEVEAQEGRDIYIYIYIYIYIHTYLWLTCIVVWQKPIQHCKAIILQLKILKNI